MECILLTGGRGFIGMNVAAAVLERGFRLVVFGRGRLDPYAREYLESLGAFDEEAGDVCDQRLLEHVMKKHGISQVIHGAALTPREAVEKEWMERTIEINCIGTLSVLKAAKACRVKRFIYAGSVAIYGASCQEQEVICEMECPLRVHTTYEISKFTSEHLIQRFCELSGMEAAVLRIADAFGPWERPTNSRVMMSAPFQVLQKALAGEKAVLSREGRMGWVYSKDIGAQAAAMLKASPGQWAYHGSSTYTWSILEFGLELKKYFPKFQIELSRDPENCNIYFYGDKDNGMFSMEAAKRDYGFSPRYGLAAAAKDYSQWALTYKHLLV